MRRTLRQLASAQPARYLQPGAPTGLTGLLTHQTPRPTLIKIYNETLEKLKKLPESSLYRQSTENLTKQRLSIIEAVKPTGYEEWAQRVKKQSESLAAENPQRDVEPEAVAIKFASPVKISEEKVKESMKSGSILITRAQSLKLVAEQKQAYAAELEAEPPLTADQILDLENKLGAGLIEEVIEVAEGELQLVDVLAENKVWEDLEEKPVEGQWTYFERSPTSPPA